MAQAKGAAGQILLYKEDSYNTPPAVISAISMPFKSEDLKGKRSMHDSEVIRGDRNATAPAFGNYDVSGSITVPIDLRGIGWWLQGLVGIPTTTQVAAKSITNGGVAVNVGVGEVGVPCVSHGFQAWETVTIANTVNYNGPHIVLPTSTTNQVNFSGAYVAETFGSDDTIRASRYSHVFKVGSATSLYSYGIEKGFTAIGKYIVYEGCKFSKMSLEVGGDKGELFMTIDIMGAIENAIASTSIDSSPTTFTLTKFRSFDTAISEAGSVTSNVRKMTVDFDNQLDGDTFVIGGGGVRGSINEGIAQPSGTIEVMFENETLYNKAVNGTESSLSLVFTRGVHTLTFDFDELLFERDGVSINTPAGIWLNAPWRSYYADDADATGIKVTLVNDVSTYVWS